MARRTLIALALLLSGVAARAQEEAGRGFEAADTLFAVYELSAGRALFREMFAHGWPADPSHRHAMVDVAGANADLLMASYLASRVGLPLSGSSYQLARKDALAKTGGGAATPGALLTEDLEAYRGISGYDGPTRTMAPVFAPVRRAKADLNRDWEADDPTTWVWKDTGDGVFTLEGYGYALLAQTAYARDQLSGVHTAQRDDKPVTLPGHSAQGGFFGLVAFHAAAAQIWELRQKLILDMRAPGLVSRPGLSRLDVKDFAFPWAWKATLNGHTLDYELADVDDKLRSRLGAQAAVLLGACEFAELCASGPAPIRALLDPAKGRGHPAELQAAATEVALFAFQSLSKLHVTVRGSGRASSLADADEKGGTITPPDLGLFLMALDAFVTRLPEPAPSGSGGRGPKTESPLRLEKDRAQTLLGSLSGMIRTWQQNQLGFFDVYSVDTSARQARTKSLAAQAFAIRGLLATHRGVQGGADSPYMQDARTALRWLDKEVWDVGLQAYREGEGSDGRRTPTLGAMALLGALREMALVSGDGRYLTRYRQFLTSLNAKGFVRQAAGRVGPSLAPEVKFQ